jgi:hypothetical protein
MANDAEVNVFVWQDHDSPTSNANNDLVFFGTASRAHRFNYP